MILLRAAGLLRHLDGQELDPDALAALELEAGNMLRAGVVLGPEHYCAMTRLERVAWGKASDAFRERERLELAAAIGVATRSPEGAAVVLDATGCPEALNELEATRRRAALEARASRIAEALSSRSSLGEAVVDLGGGD